MRRCKATWKGDKQGMIGCEATDRKHKVNTELRDHKDWTCPLLSIPPPLPTPLTSEPRSLFLPLYRWLTFSLFPWEKTFLPFFWHFSFSLSPSLPCTHYLTVIRHPITAVPSDKDYVLACVCVCVCVCLCFNGCWTDTHTHTHTHTAIECQIPGDACYSPSQDALLSSIPCLIWGWGI